MNEPGFDNMSRLVNYKKRSITLPAGCKDLIEVIKPHEMHAVQGICESPLPDSATCKHTERAKLSEIEKYLSLVFEPSAAAATLLIVPPDTQVAIDIARMEDGSIFASADVQMGSAQETAVRQFFVQHQLELPDSTEIPGIFSTHAPVFQMWEISPLPLEVPLLAKLCSNFFREVCGLSDESELCFEHHNVLKSA
jgi:hypothetical protein